MCYLKRQGQPTPVGQCRLHHINPCVHSPTPTRRGDVSGVAPQNPLHPHASCFLFQGDCQRRVGHAAAAQPVIPCVAARWLLITPLCSLQCRRSFLPGSYTGCVDDDTGAPGRYGIMEEPRRTQDKENPEIQRGLPPRPPFPRTASQTGQHGNSHYGRPP